MIRKKKNEKSIDHHGPMEDPKTLDSQMILVTENYGLKLHPMVQFIITFPWKSAIWWYTPICKHTQKSWWTTKNNMGFDSSPFQFLDVFNDSSAMYEV